MNAEAINTIIDAGRAAGRETALKAACEPWKLCSGDPPDWDSPLMDVWQAAICWTLRIVGATLGAKDWETGDGSETLDGDVAAEVGNIMRAAGLVNSDGDPITRDELAALLRPKLTLVK